MRRLRGLCILLRTTASMGGWRRRMESIWEKNTYWIADICGGDDARVKEYCEKFDDCVEIEEHQDLLAAWLVAKALSESKRSGQGEYGPTAVYLLRMWKIIIPVMNIATICMKHVAVGTV